ncbi:MAG TPA: hypothetical protein VF656_03650 [Pyrinomonadaceae bacterium]|jgi:hypothetical protein
MIVSFLKYLSQILLLIGGIISFWREPYITTPRGKRPSVAGWITIAAFVAGFILFIITDIKERSDDAQRDAMQQQQISYLRQLHLNHNLSRVELSFKPSTDHWSKIAEAYSQTNPPNMALSYIDTLMIAERNGDYWKIDFKPINRAEGIVTFNPVTTDKPDGKWFENIIREAAINLWIKWGDSAPTEIRPEREDYYPAAIEISEDRIAFILRDPQLKWNLNNLHDNPIIMLRGGKNRPNNLRVRSLDDVVMFDQTFDLNWTEKDDGSFESKIMPYISGPHRLNPMFKFEPKVTAQSR